LELASDEGANALRVYAEDKAGKIYRFPVVNIQPLKGQDWIYAVTIQLSDQIGYWDPPTADGDVLFTPHLARSFEQSTASWSRQNGRQNSFRSRSRADALYKLRDATGEKSGGGKFRR
jgi:hypothetical protein